MGKETQTIRRRAFTAAVTAGCISLSGCGIGKGDGFSGGCDRFVVYAQNRFDPLGAAVREQPTPLAKTLSPGFLGNEVIVVDGWIDSGAPAYPSNPAPWNSPVWLHVPDRQAYVSFPGVRSNITSPTDTNAGQPVELRPECKGTYTP